MVHFKILRHFLIFCLFCATLPMLIGCGGANNSDELVPQIFVVPAGTEKRLISEEQIPLNNCDGNFEITQTIERKHSILYTLQLENGVSVNVEGKAKIPEFGEVGVGGAVAAKYQVGYGREESLSRSVTVGAEGGSNIQHTIRQYEIWETGNVLLVLGEKSEEIPYSFRRDFSIEPLEPANLGCSAQTEPPTQSPTAQETPTSTNPKIETRSDKLVLYDSIYQQEGWCNLWNQLVNDNLVRGDCPQAVNDIAREDIVNTTGQKVNLITGVQITIPSEISVNYPACINYGIDGDYATLSGGKIRSWTSNSNVATDVSVMPNSIFTLYFRCDHITWQ